MKLKIKLTLTIVILLTGCNTYGQPKAHPDVIKFMRNVGLGEKLDAPVNVDIKQNAPVKFDDKGEYFYQYDILGPEMTADPNVVLTIEKDVPVTADKLVIVTHGWLDKGENSWPSDIADAVYQRTDHNEWLCGWYDWSGGAAVVSPIFAAQYARDIAGPRLAAAVKKMPNHFRHIHLIGHSAGAWTIDSAAKQLVKAFPDAEFHLTFLDAYVPHDWNPNSLGQLYADEKMKSHYWAEHYYTKDITLKVTEQNLRHAHNVDITALDPWVSEHEFPYRWYLATITGHYSRWDEKGEPVKTKYEDIEYGYTTSLESSQQNWQKYKTLPQNNKPVIMGK